MQRGPWWGFVLILVFCVVIESFVRDVLAYYHPWHHHYCCYRMVHRYAEEENKSNNWVESTRMLGVQGIVLNIPV